MLKDFIKVNSIDAEIISFRKETSLQTALFETKMSPLCAVRVEFFMNDKDDEFLFVYPLGTKLDLEKLKHLTGSFEFFSKTDKEVLEAIGYEKETLPPIGIYGVKVYLDKSVQEKEYLLCKISEKDFLKIPPMEIIDANEDSLVENISKPK